MVPGVIRVWQAHIRRRGYPAQVRTFDTKAEAQAWAAGIENEIARGVFLSRTEAENTTLAGALDRYLVEIVPQKKNADREGRRVKAFQDRPLARRSMASIQGKDIANFIRDRQAAGAGPNTVRLDLALLSHVFNIARKEWGMGSLSNPVELVRKPKLPPGRNRRFVDDEQDRLLAAATTYGGEIGPLITWAIETAMRRGEIAAMRWERIDWQTHVLTVPWEETKTSEARGVPLSRAALAVLESLPRKVDGLVWSLSPDSISQAFERVCERAGIKDLTFHDLRHEAASRLTERGLGLLQVKAITGHKTVQMLGKYTHLRAEDLVGKLG
ncbi:MAG TPA: site-specific integrase [Acidiferrobacter sp.]|nr:site-specific integrase [Acidiferrobacter sp.]